VPCSASVTARNVSGAFDTTKTSTTPHAYSRRERWLVGKALDCAETIC
jgi:hypothetical protein